MWSSSQIDGNQGVVQPQTSEDLPPLRLMATRVLCSTTTGRCFMVFDDRWLEVAVNNLG
jgi:hypothetical protein